MSKSARKRIQETGIIILISVTLSVLYNALSPLGLNLLYQTPPPEPGTAVDLAGFQQLLKLQACVVDVREPDAFRSGHIPGALNLSLRQPRAAKIAFVQHFDPLQKFVFYCSSEQCNQARRMAGEFKLMGYEQVYIYEAGIEGWAAQGLPIEEEQAQ